MVEIYLRDLVPSKIEEVCTNYRVPSSDENYDDFPLFVLRDKKERTDFILDFIAEKRARTKPLSMNDLRKMDRKPIWVVPIRDSDGAIPVVSEEPITFPPQWAIYDDIEFTVQAKKLSDMYRFSLVLSKRDYMHTWIAYYCEQPEEDETMYDANKRVEFTAKKTTVGEIISHLAKFDPNATFEVCGDTVFYLHAEQDGSVVTLDNSSMEDEYDQGEDHTTLQGLSVGIFGSLRNCDTFYLKVEAEGGSVTSMYPFTPEDLEGIDVAVFSSLDMRTENLKAGYEYVMKHNIPTYLEYEFCDKFGIPLNVFGDAMAYINAARCMREHPELSAEVAQLLLSSKLAQNQTEAILQGLAKIMTRPSAQKSE